ncbi:MAG: hypothetical protein A3G49_05505 [Candidatus Sungbacteria bacterium RIFCSPLOWO2_12_FULL_41_11]|uniref:Metal-dependent hydrolase n=1 Tax=Candidatus Sungbacteria bacterium RIFCSPLOWO2_12_FULL_41_11 TaxID=1802286 RepID=A0A1G2LSJ4_9BACT|nr:MAG: hypothetical protein UV01_C0008G0047 [Parcubacteria group bacterium GW2011_GWA2_42_14]OHA14618.1 MAG: hypothetical protein A3G49_05505 [Candidatus Sungbacteria bacterium RIFCSPLOWO2_12_FULL_41_11]
MFIDLASGMVVYVIVSLFFGIQFDYRVLGLSIFFAFFPDLDFIPYVLLRRRFKLVSHHIIHFPLMLIPVGAGLVWLVTQSSYLAILFALGVFIHFLHDGSDKTGMYWLWPLMRRPYQLTGRGFVMSAEARRAVFEESRKGADKRSAWDEVTMRMEAVGVKTKAYLLVALLLVLLHAFLF